MIFVSAITLAIFFAGVFIALELKGRRLRGLKPSTIAELWLYAQKRASPKARYAALIFALVSLFFFQIWEALLRFLLQRDPLVIFFVVGLVLPSIAIVLRQKRLSSQTETDLRLGRYTLVLLCFGLSALLNSWGTLLFVPWIWFRANFLPSRLG